MEGRRQPCSLIAMVLLWLLLCACSATPGPSEPTDALPPIETSAPPPPTEIPPSPTPTIKVLPTASYTSDPEAQHYLQGVEDILRHSARILPQHTLSLGDVCPDRYVIAFVYVEPDARGGITLHVDALPQEADGTVREGEHAIIWSIQREGLYWDRWNHIYMTDHSQPGSYQLQFLLEEPQGSGWQVGTAFGSCPGDDLRLTSLFAVHNYLDYDLIYTRYNEDAPYDFWLRDGDQLHLYRWEPWEATLLWTLEGAPGALSAVMWTEESPDVDGDGSPDLILSWQVDGEIVSHAYAEDDHGFTLVGLADGE